VDTNFRSKGQPTFYEVCGINLLSLWKNRNFVLPFAIEENCEQSFLMEMLQSLNFINTILRSDPLREMIIGIKHP
jgi:hypothetical protein